MREATATPSRASEPMLRILVFILKDQTRLTEIKTSAGLSEIEEYID